MTSFYAKAIDNQELGPFFRDEIGDDLTDEDWIAHIDLLADFWLTKMLGEDTYYGNFIGAHVKMPLIKRESFAIWLELFSQTADEVYVPETAELFKKRAIELVKEFFSSKKKI